MSSATSWERGEAMAANQPDLVLRIIEPGAHRQALMGMCRDVFRETPSEEQFRWKYEDSPQGAMIVSSAWDVARGDDRLAGAFSAYRRLFIHDGRIITVFQDADAMVDASYRGQGVFGKLTDALSAEVKREGAPFHFGYSNGQSSPLLGKRPDARMLALSRTFAFPIGFDNAASTYLHLKGIAARLARTAGGLAVRAWNSARRYGRPNGLSLEPVDRFDDLPLAWSRENAQHYRFFPVRNREFLNWRAIDVPPAVKAGMLSFWIKDGSTRIGYCVLYADAPRNVLKLVDVLCEQPARRLAPCIAAIRSFAIANGYDVVTTNVAGGLHQRALVASGFWPVSDVVSYLLITDPDALRHETYDGDFWLQLPIDRDNFDY